LDIITVHDKLTRLPTAFPLEIGHVGPLHC